VKRNLKVRGSNVMVILTVIYILNGLSDRDFSRTFDNWKRRWADHAVKGGNMLKGITFIKAYNFH